jgi:hypothetical protein
LTRATIFPRVQLDPIRETRIQERGLVNGRTTSPDSTVRPPLLTGGSSTSRRVSFKSNDRNPPTIAT